MGGRTSAVVAGSTVTTTSGLGVGHVDPNSSTVELLVVHLLDGSIGLLLSAVGLRESSQIMSRFNSVCSEVVHTTKPKPLDRPVSLSFMTMH